MNTEEELCPDQAKLDWERVAVMQQMGHAMNKASLNISDFMPKPTFKRRDSGINIFPESEC